MALVAFPDPFAASVCGAQSDSGSPASYLSGGFSSFQCGAWVVIGTSSIFSPMRHSFAVTSAQNSTRRHVVLGNRACAFIILPITAMLTTLGRSVIEAWVGPTYVATSYPVLLILLYPTTMMHRPLPSEPSAALQSNVILLQARATFQGPLVFPPTKLDRSAHQRS
jgi:hypothetical protein